MKQIYLQRSLNSLKTYFICFELVFKHLKRLFLCRKTCCIALNLSHLNKYKNWPTMFFVKFSNIKFNQNRYSIYSRVISCVRTDEQSDFNTHSSGLRIRLKTLLVILNKGFVQLRDFKPFNFEYYLPNESYI